MALFSSTDRTFVVAAGHITYANPFLPERIEYEKQALGKAFIELESDWNVRYEAEGEHPNISCIMERAVLILDNTRRKLERKLKVTETDLQLYEDLVILYAYHQFRDDFDTTIAQVMNTSKPRRKVIRFYDKFEKLIDRYMILPYHDMPSGHDSAHLFACFFQVRRAFYHIYSQMIGTSKPIVQLRAAAWQSIFTHDARRYRRSLYKRMSDFTTLITGASGTGKELVARAVGLSRYISFDPATKSFTEDFAGTFFPLNLSALSPTLIESELFGHKRGAFTGAVDDRIGWLEQCPPQGTVFLDEIGDLDGEIQVKLLRVLQTGIFNRLGDTTNLPFKGKIIAATNRNLPKAIAAGQFREDFFYRLCSDMIETPQLHEQLIDKPNDLRTMVRFIAEKLAGEEEADCLTKQVVQFIEKTLGLDYAWPGNFRELEQCVRNLLIRNEYQPMANQLDSQSIRQHICSELLAGNYTADELLQQYCTLIYHQTGNYEATARKLDLDRRTIKAKIDREVLEILIT